MNGRPTDPRSGELVARPPVRASEDRTLVARVGATHRLEGVAGGSALLRIGDRLLAVHDDAWRVSLIELPSLVVTPFVLAGDGAPLPKLEKPDFEAAVRTGDGAVHLLGSGSTDKRCKIARIDLASATVALLERPALYRRVQDALESAERPNIEGAAVVGDRLRLFNRAAGRTPNASVDLPLEALAGGATNVLTVRTFDLGAIAGIALGFTDVAPIADGRVAFVAAAEDAPDAIADGPVVGSVVGVVETTGREVAARWTRLVDANGRTCTDKVEGLAIDDDAAGGWLLTDSDDPGMPAALIRVALDGFG